MTDDLTPDDLAEIEARLPGTSSPWYAEDVPRLVRALREAWEVGLMLEGAHESALHTAAAIEAERDRLRAQVEAVRAVHGPDDHGPGRCDAEGCPTDCVECGAEWPCPTIRALDAQQPATATTSTPDGSEGVETENGAQIAVDDFLSPWTLHGITREEWFAKVGADMDRAFARAGIGGTPVPWTGPESPPAYVVPLAPCGDRITTWHGRFGPCVLTGKHDLHDDGHGVVWSWTETETP
jgi:hypothetical protein